MKIYHQTHESSALKDIRLLIPLARKERVPVKATKTPVEYWCAVINDTVVGFQGASIINSNTARLKTTFVHPNYRGSGIFDKLFSACLQNLESRGIKVFTGFFTPMSISTGIRYGFVPQSTKKDSDIVFAVRTLNESI